MSSAYTDFIIKTNSAQDANKVVSIIKCVASERTPEYPNEITKFIDDISVDNTTVKVEYSYSIMDSTFCELVPQIMRRIARYDLREITMDAWFTSCNCGYEAEFSGRIFKNGKLRISFQEHE